MRTRSALALDVRTLLAAAEAQARLDGGKAAIAKHDDGGHPLGFSHKDGVGPTDADLGQRKSLPAALSQRSSRSCEERLEGGRLAVLATPPPPLQDGRPIIVPRHYVGDTGTPGVQSRQDEQRVHAGSDTHGG